MSQSIATLKQIYPDIKQADLDKLNIKFEHIEPLIEFWSGHPLFDITKTGESFQGRGIYHIKVGQGPIKVFLWSQMHGNEPTATAALFDLFNYLAAAEHDDWYQGWKDSITLHIAPMINPDGAEQNSRYNAQGIDINRDASATQSLEGKLLNQLADEIQPDFGFNLHDQARFYSAGKSDKTATISLLAPPFNEAQEINAQREHAMKLIALMNQDLQPEIPGCVGRYDDTFAARCFGDRFAAKGIATLLIESGHYPNDPNRQNARWLNFMLLVRAINAIKEGSYKDLSIDQYHQIPMNVKDALVDILLTKVSTSDYCTDLGINFDSTFNNASIVDIGDLSPLYGLESHDMSDYELMPARGYSISEPLSLTDKNYLEFLREGYSHFIGERSLIRLQTNFPVISYDSPQSLEIPQRDGKVHMIFSRNNSPVKALIDGQWMTL